MARGKTLHQGRSEALDLVTFAKTAPAGSYQIPIQARGIMLIETRGGQVVSERFISEKGAPLTFPVQTIQSIQTASAG